MYVFMYGPIRRLMRIGRVYVDIYSPRSSLDILQFDDS